ncbi:uncharacterized protein LOC131688174 [Topomyia yanbarensis]|uniref:uncharacterized protein LOC131688174 n=1 Tax=Topomyia yanbarensis TaxID=2498891 RepID=UPI00273BFCE3|nr:uncharacterized protein LOC131688174 [Topomyia yanbarensis]
MAPLVRQVHIQQQQDGNDPQPVTSNAGRVGVAPLHRCGSDPDPFVTFDPAFENGNPFSPGIWDEKKGRPKAVLSFSGIIISVGIGERTLDEEASPAGAATLWESGDDGRRAADNDLPQEFFRFRAEGGVENGVGNLKAIAFATMEGFMTKQQLTTRRTTLLASLSRAEQFMERYNEERDKLEAAFHDTFSALIHSNPDVAGSYPVTSTQTRDGPINESSMFSATTAVKLAKSGHHSPLPDAEKSILMLTVVLVVVDRYGKEHLARALLDCGSQPNIISERMVQILRLKRKRANVLIQGIGNQPQHVTQSVSTQVRSRKEDFALDVNFLILEKVTSNLPACDVLIDDWCLPEKLFLADPNFNKRAGIDMIIGNEHFFSCFKTAARIELSNSLPTLVDSVFGWLVSGTATIFQPSHEVLHHSITAVSLATLEESLERFWETEELPNQSNYSIDEQNCEQLYAANVARDSEGRYVVRFPRHPNFEEMLGESKAAAQRRFESLERRLYHDDQLQKEYSKFLHEYIALGHMRLVPPHDKFVSNQCFLPHHPVVKELAEDEGRSYPLGGPALRKGYYVDDFIAGAQSVEEATQLRSELNELLSKGGFSLRKWTSNKLQVLQGLSADEIGTHSSLKFDKDETVKALGISWEPQRDILRFDTNISQKGKLTKRAILSKISQLFDPLGLIAPVIIRGEILMQHLWLESYGWDDEVPENIATKWKRYSEQLPLLTGFRVSRYAFLPNAEIQLHTFADASETAYGACTYARSVDTQCNISVQLLASKSRVAPLKRVTLLRLELCAADLAAKLHSRIIQALQINIASSFFWSDSMVTLQWLKSPPNTWKTYIANRVSAIQTATHGAQWKHVASKQNPADLVSRGLETSELLNSAVWKHGPAWLSLIQEQFPSSSIPDYPNDGKERRKVVVASAKIEPLHNPYFSRFSSHNRLVRVTAYCLRFAQRCLMKTRTQLSNEPLRISLAVKELTNAQSILVRIAQHDVFKQEIKDLKRD